MKRDARSVSSYATTAIRKLRVMMVRGRIVVLFLLVVLIAVVFSGTSLSRKTSTVSAKVSGQSKSEPSLTTDRENYSPGDAVTFTGRNWKAGEAVSVVVSEDTSGEKVTLEATADASGSFMVTGALPLAPKMKASGRRGPDSDSDKDLEDAPGAYTVIANSTSGVSAEVQFSTADGDTDGDNLLENEAFWMQRLTYPTGKFNAAWVREAARQDARIERGIPAGRKVSKFSLLGVSPMQLNPNAFTAIGPQPEQMTGCSGCFDYGTTSGRVNSIAIDPTTTTNGSIVAYIATVGGGVWKSTNCCSGSTTWSVTTEDPLVATTSVDTVTIDPNNHSTIYAGTGDLNYGSFSMGSQGILKSTNAGATWAVKGADIFGAALPEPAGQFPQYQAVGKVRVDPNNSNNVVAGTKTGLYFSYNGGDNWTGPCLPDSFATQRQDITGLELTNLGGGITRILAAVGTRGFATPVQYNLDQNGANGLYKGTMPASGCPSDFTLITRNDNGFNFGTLVTGSPYATSGNMNAGTGVPYGGNTTTGNQLGRMDIAVAPSNPNVLYAQVGSIAANNNSGCGNTSGCQLGVWASTDGGATWSFMTGSAGGALRNCLGTNTSSNPGDYPQNWYDQGMAVDPNNPDRVFIDTYDTWLATRTGTSFYNVTCGYNGSALSNHVVHVDHHALAFVPGSSSILLEGSDGGIFSSINADAAVSGVTRNTWVNMDTGLNTIEFYSGDISGNFANSASPQASGGAQDNGPSSVLLANPIGPSQWQMGLGGDGFYSRIDPVGTGTSLRFWQGNNSGGLSRCTANCTSPGATWTSRRGAWTGDQQSFVLPFELFHGDVNNPANDCGAAGATTGCGHLIAGTVRVWETLTGATGTNTWYVNSPANLTKASLGNRSYINQLAFEPSSQNTVMVGTNDGNVQIGFGMGGGSFTSTWVNVTGSNAVLPNRPILDVAFNPTTTTAPIAYAAVGGFDQNTPTTPGHVFQVVCTANCASFTWTNKTGNLPNIPVDSIIANPNFPQQVFAGTDFGLYYTDDITAITPVWQRFSAGLPSVMIWDMQIDRGATTLSVWTRGRGAFVWPLPLGALNPLATSFSASDATGTYGGTVNLSATITSGGNGLSGKTVNFTLNGSGVGSAVTNSNGVATLSNVSLAGINAGTYPGAVGASFAGDTNYASSNGSSGLTVNPATSSTTVNCPASVPYNGSAQTPCTASYQTSDGLNSGLSVNYSNNTNVGTASASATYAGDSNHTGSSDSETFQISCLSSSPMITSNSDSGAGSLRYAIASVCAGGTINFNGGLTGTISLTSGELVINRSMTIQGPGANLLTIQRSTAGGTSSFRNVTITSGATVTIAGLTLSNGNSNDGSAIFVDSSTLNVVNSAIRNNSGAFTGGGISNNQGTVNVFGSTISGNSSVYGGGISSNGTVTVINSTISGNAASVGGAIYSNGSGTLEVVNSTISGNSGDGGIASLGTFSLWNSIVALNTPNSSSDITGPATSLGHNVLGTTSGSSITPTTGDQFGVTAAQLKLGALADRGGPTPTMALGAGSVAIDAGDDCVTQNLGCLPLPLTTDQRGHARKVGTSVDVGAYEVGAVSGDFDRDLQTEVAVWTPSTGEWRVLDSSNNQLGPVVSWGSGALGDQIVPGDYDGDGKTDIAVWRPSEGNWYIINSSNNSVTVRGWGDSTDVPVPADYDGDGKTDLAVFRPSEGNWYILQSSTNTVRTQGWGVSTDKLVPADYDGDGKADIAVWRGSEGNWYIINSLGGTTVNNWGTASLNDIPVPADYDGDGKADLAVFRASETDWYIKNSSTGTATVVNWGATDDQLVPADYDGDGRTDIAVFRPSEGNWYIIKSSDISLLIKNIGGGADVPVPKSYSQH